MGTAAVTHQFVVVGPAQLVDVIAAVGKGNDKI